jgi:hypothetical protein
MPANGPCTAYVSSSVVEKRVCPAKGSMGYAKPVLTLATMSMSGQLVLSRKLPRHLINTTALLVHPLRQQRRASNANPTNTNIFRIFRTDCKHVAHGFLAA